MIVVSDTGPMIALAKVGHLDLLSLLFGELSIPPMVHRELFAKRGPEIPYLDNALTNFVKVVPAPPRVPQVEIATRYLDVGEQQAIALAYQHKALLIIDERLGRTAARRLNLTITGVVGVLIQAKQLQHIDAVMPLLKSMRQTGYWLSDELLGVAAQLTHE